MSSINIMGTYSGITMDTIDQLMEAEAARGNKYTTQKTEIESERNAWKDINTRLDSLFKNLETLQDEATFESHTVSSNVRNSLALSVSAGSDAATGSYRVHVSQLATASRLTGGKVDVESIYTDIEGLSGALTFTNHDSEIFEVTLEEGQAYSLKDVENLINKHIEESGIQASIVDNRLVLTDTVYGERNISVAGELAGSLNLTGVEISTGQQAHFTVNGIEIQSDTNTIDDVVEGLTFELTNVHESSAGELITVESDTDKTVNAVKKFVEQYNSTMSFISDQMDVGDPSLEDNETGALTGDGTLMRLESGLRSILTRAVTDGSTGDIRSIEDLGIEVDRYGVATLDEEVLNKALQEDPTNVARFFYREEPVPVEGSETGETTSKLEKQGMSELLKNFVDTYISSSTGIISTKNETYDRMLKDINEQIDVFNERIERKRAQYIQQFTALDIAMMEAQSQMDYMYSQLGMNQTSQ